VITDTAPPNVPSDPIATPCNVTTHGELAAAVPDATVMTKFDIWIALEVACNPPLAATPDTDVPMEKNPDGKDNVMVLGAASAPPADGVKLNVTGAILLVSLSLLAMLNSKAATALPMYPDGVLADVKGSWLVDTVTGPPAVASVPVVMPTNVTVTAALAATLPDCSVSTMFDGPLAPEIAVTPLKVTVGVTLGARKPVG